MPAWLFRRILVAEDTARRRAGRRQGHRPARSQRGGRAAWHGTRRPAEARRRRRHPATGRGCETRGSRWRHHVRHLRRALPGRRGAGLQDQLARHFLMLRVGRHAVRRVADRPLDKLEDGHRPAVLHQAEHGVEHGQGRHAERLGHLLGHRLQRGRHVGRQATGRRHPRPAGQRGTPGRWHRGRRRHWLGSGRHPRRRHAQSGAFVTKRVISASDADQTGVKK
jgi:hypothetical protein